MILRRSYLLLALALGMLPKQAGQLETPPPLPPMNRLVFGGDVMMSRYVGVIAAAKRDK